MEYLYIFIAIVALIAECSDGIDTKNLFKKIGLLLVVLGCLINISGHDNNFIIFGLFLYALPSIFNSIKLKIK